MIGAMHPKGVKPKKQRQWAQGNYGRGGPVRAERDPDPVEADTPAVKRGLSDILKHLTKVK